MTYVNTLQTNSTTYNYDDLETAIANGDIDTDDVTNVSIFNASTDESACTDGEDDGKISLGSKIGSALKGAVSWVGNTVKGMFTDEDGNFSLGQTIKSALTIGACFIPGVGPVIATGLAAYGAVTGVKGIAEGASAAANATTDAEAKEAWESIGGSALQTGVSVAGVKAGAKAVKGNLTNAGVDTSSLSSTVKGLTKSSGEAATTVTGKVTNTLNNLTGNYYQGTWSNAGGGLKGLEALGKQAVEGTGKNVLNAAKSIKQKASNMKNSAKEAITKKGTTEGASATEAAETTKTTKTGKTFKEAIKDTIKSKKSSSAESAAETAETAKTTKTKSFDTLKENLKETKIGTKASEVKASIKSDYSRAKTYYNNTTGNDYQALGSTSNKAVLGTAALGTVSATGASSSNYDEQIAAASTTYATVDTQTGHEYTLDDYSIKTEDEVDEAYTQIMSDSLLA